MIPLIAQSTSLGHGLPKGRLVNMVVQATPQGPAKFAPVQRPALVEEREDGDGPIKLIVQALGAVYVLSGAEVYRNGSLIGSVASGGYFQAAASDTELVIVSGWNAYTIQATSVTQIALDFQTSGVVYLGGRFVYAVRGTGQFFWSAIGNASVIDGLSFATAESSPDAIVRMETLGDDVVFGGEESVEFWGVTASGDLPYARSPGRRYDKGVLALYSLQKVDNGLFWVGQEDGQDPIVYRDGQPLRISTYSIEARLAECPAPQLCKAFKLISKGHTFYVLNIPDVGTFAYDVGENLWAEWSSYQRTTFRVGCGGSGLFGDEVNGKLYRFDPDARTDDGEPIVKIVGGFAPVSNLTRCNHARLYAVAGVGLATGQGSEPVVDMRYTDGLDGDWTDWLQGSLGAQGDREARAEWWGLELLHAPGRYFEFRCSDPVDFAPYGLGINEGRT